MDFSEQNIKDKIKLFKQSESYKRGPFYNGTQGWIFETDNTDLFRNAVWQGYLDASRTFHGIKDTKDKHDAFDKLAMCIQSYFMGNSSFDHYGWCCDFIKDIGRFNACKIHYGQAQKVVNMAFKYLFCCAYSEQIPDIFKPCHMPIDNLVLKWLNGQKGTAFIGWSKLEFGAYNNIQEQIKTILDKELLKKEFVIWDTMKRINS